MPVTEVSEYPEFLPKPGLASLRESLLLAPRVDNCEIYQARPVGDVLA